MTETTTNGTDGEAPLANLERTSVVDQVQLALRDWIVSGELPMGSRLTESRLAERLGVARNTVREAIRGLVAVHLVEHDPHRGFFVPSLRAAEIEELYRIRMVLEVGSLELDRLPIDAHLEELERSVRELDEAAGSSDLAAMFGADRDFHVTLAGRCGPRVAAALGQVFDELMIALVAHDRTAGTTGVVAGQRRLLTALRTGSPGDARRALEAHIEESRRAALGQLGS